MTFTKIKNLQLNDMKIIILDLLIIKYKDYALRI